LTRHLFRWSQSKWRKDFTKPFVQIVFGARQTGKSTLVRSLPAKGPANWVFVDEAQWVPSVFDAVQHLYDRDQRRWHFILCGSSARKLRQTGANLLPGRSFLHRLFPLTLAERPAPEPPVEFDAPAPLSLAWPDRRSEQRPFPAADLMERLASGNCPASSPLPEISARKCWRPTPSCIWRRKCDARRS
jgi:predicted AAA+ superfamily ATPase